MQLNQQAPERALLTPNNIEVHSMWHTIQGEGPYAGRPAVFVRLAGCNMRCPQCDTQYTVGRRVLTVSDAVKETEALLDDNPNTELVVITGGEPFRQLSLLPFVRQLSCPVQIETNGVAVGYALDVDEWHDVRDDDLRPVTIVCSPKASQVSDALIHLIDCYKYVLRANESHPEDGLPMTCLGYPRPPARPPIGFPKASIFVQPLDEQDDVANLANAKAVADICLLHGYRFQMQVHKLVGLD